MIPGNRSEDQEWDDLFEWLSGIGLKPAQIRAWIEAAPDLIAMAERALNQSARVHPDFARQIRLALRKAEPK